MKVSRRAAVLGGAAIVLAVVPSVAMRLAGRSFPADTTPEGAYLRVALAVTQERVADAFAYLETEAQWACFTIWERRKKAIALVRSAYPEPDRSRLEAAYAREGDAPDAPDVFARIAADRGFVARLRRDLSGVASVEIQGERATVVTARGTRYAFRRRENGIWGLTLFTAELRAEAERADRDVGVVERAAADYRAATP